MKTSTSVFNRLVLLVGTFLFGIVAVWAISTYFDLAPAQWLKDTGRMASWGQAVEQSWYHPVLAGIAVFLVIVGLVLLISNLRRYGFNRKQSPQSNESGSIELPLAKIADSIADDLEQTSGVESAKSRVFRDNNLETVEVTVNMGPTADPKLVIDSITRSEDDFRAAIDGLEVASRYKLNVN